jgi:hypothetical protein
MLDLVKVHWCEGDFEVLQICYSNRPRPYLTSLALTIPPPD